jgi:methyl-accepting chemotaxis protein
MSIKRSLFLIVIINIALWLAMCVFYLYNALTLRSDLNRLITVEQLTLNNLNDMYAQGLRTEQATRTVLLDPNDSEAKRNFADATNKFLASAASIEKHLSQGPQRKSYVDMMELWNKSYALKVEVQKLAISGNTKEAQSLLIEKETSLWRQLRDTLLSMISVQKVAFEAAVTQSQTKLSRMTYFIVGSMIIALIISAFLILRITRRITQGL